MANSTKYLYIYKSIYDTHIEYVHIHVEHTHIHMIHAYKMCTHTYIYIYKWQPTPVFLPGEFHGQRSLVGFSPWGHRELDTAERLSHTLAQSCLTLYDPMDCSLPASSHGISQARVLEWVATAFSRGSSPPRDQTRVSRIVGRRFTV